MTESQCEMNAPSEESSNIPHFAQDDDRAQEECEEETEQSIAENDGERDISSQYSATSVVFHSFEQVLKVVGAFGSYQIAFVCCVQLAVVLWCGNFVFMSYATYKPHITCVTLNGTILEMHKASTDAAASKAADAAFCAAYENGLCENATWESPFYTVIEEWKLICDRDYLPQTFNSIQMSGTALAMFLSGQLADFLGRKFVFYGTFLMLILSGMVSTLSTGPVMFAVCRFFVGSMLSASLVTNFVWSMEITDQKHNAIVNCANLWHFAYMFTAFVGWLTRDWKTYLLVTNGLLSPLNIFYARFNESPRWLIQKGQLERAAKLLTKIDDQNRPLHTSC